MNAFERLSRDAFLHIFTFIPLRQHFLLQRTCRLWRKWLLAQEQVQMTLSLSEPTLRMDVLQERITAVRALKIEPRVSRILRTERELRELEASLMTSSGPGPDAFFRIKDRAASETGAVEWEHKASNTQIGEKSELE